jgi:hypothetical protein
MIIESDYDFGIAYRSVPYLEYGILPASQLEAPALPVLWLLSTFLFLFYSPLSI